MKKQLILSMVCLMALMLPFFAVAQEEGNTIVVIGTETTSNYTAPFNAYYKNSTSETIYTAAEVGTAGYIDTVWFYSASETEFPVTSLHIYMGTTMLSSFTANGWVMPTLLEEVYSVGALTLGGSEGWFAFPLQNPFYYNGTENLLVAVTKTAANYSSASVWRYSTGTNRYIYRQSDGTLSYGDIYSLDASTSGTQSYYVANIRLSIDTETAAPSCIRPTALTLDTVTADSIHISWTASGEETVYQVEVIRGLDTIRQMVYDETEATFTELMSDTRYEVRVYSVCDGEQSYNSAILNFRTACAPVQVPFNESFESGEISPCWEISSTSSYSYGNWRINTSQSHTGSYSVEADADYTPMLTSCVFDFSDLANGAYIDFWYMLPVSSYSNQWASLQLSYRTSPTGTWTTITTYDVATDDSWANVAELDLPNSAEAPYYQLRFTGLEDGDIYLDDISVSAVSDCVRPRNVVVETLGYNEVTLAWTGCDLAYNYEVRYGLTSDVNAPGNQNITIGAESATLTGLTPETTYYVWVRTNCGSEITSWSQPCVFTTQQSCARLVDVTLGTVTQTAAALSWNINTEEGESMTAVSLQYKADTADTWNEYLVTDQNYYFLAGLEGGVNYTIKLTTICGDDMSDEVIIPFTTPTCAEYGGGSVSSSTVVPFNPFYNYGYSQSLYPGDALMGDTIRGIYWRTDQSNSMARTISIAMGNTNVTSLSETSFIPYASLTQVVTNATVNFSTAGWVYIPFTTPFVYDGSLNIVVAVSNTTGSYSSFHIYQHASTPGSSVYWYHDDGVINPASPSATMSGVLNVVPDVRFNIDCDAQQCTAPIVAVIGTDVDQIEIAWMPTGDEFAWVVGSRLYDGGSWNYETVTGTTYTISSLVSSSHYLLRVGVECDDDTVFSAVHGYTDCSTITAPYSQNFDVDGFDRCWYRSNSSVEFYHGELYFFGQRYAVLPELNDVISGLQVRFDAFDQSTGRIIVGVCESVEPLTGFTIIDTLQITSNTEEYEVPFSNYDGDGRRIVLMGLTGYHYIDNLVVEPIPTCIRPNSLAVSNIGTDGATLTWNSDNAAPVCWLVQYGDFTADGDTHTLATVSVQGTLGSTYTFTGLTPATYYWCTVRTVCSTDDTSRISRSTLFMTDCNTIDAPWQETFSSWDEGDVPTCWDCSQTTIGSPEDVGSVYDYYGNKMLLSDVGALAYGECVILTPRIVIPSDANYDFSFKYSHVATVGDVTVSISTDDGVNFVDLGTFSNTTGDESYYPGTFSTAHYNLSTYAGNTVVFRFSYDNMYDDGSIFIDDVAVGEYVEPPVECEVPTGLTASATGSTTATVSWTPVGDEVEWQLLISSLAGEYTYSLGATTTPLQSLEPSTTYQISVRAICGEGDTSDWSSPVSFTTQGVGIDDIDARFAVQIYPNPASQTARIDIDGVAGWVSLMVTDVDGRVIYNDRLECGAGCSKQFQVAGLAQGAYFVRIVAESGIVVRKLFVLQ